ncbi:Dynactin subunit [Echinococcus granulosus]|uniref:Dynactin subunit 4 n=1 Tax=Echinococcus granulosus TaxID=6210 RepID=W6U1S9_ECHGR|nr:Dynactin subunit [Echinococcus granulosus]EUB54988.1 Dynactin subunit [Echinococcus granulosus]
MATYFDLCRVQGFCSCNRCCPLSQLYFCRHCYDVRCGNCVSHEVDSHYCPNCLENMTSAEAKMRKHRCGNCFDCPSCGHTLSTRGTLALAPAAGTGPADPTSGDSPMTAQKTYYLLCGFCRWSTRESGISDQKSPGGWNETPNPHAERIETLITEYRQLAAKEKTERERSNRETNPSPEVEISAAQAQAITESFNVDELVNKPFSFERATSALQRHMAPALQPTETRSLEPRHKALAVKRSLRCKKCEHTLSKADFNPSYTKFRINLSAICHVPDLHFALPPSSLADSAGDIGRRRITPLPLPTLGFDSAPPSSVLRVKGFSMSKASNVVLIVSNPAHRVTTVRLRQLTAEEENAKLAEFFAKNGSVFGAGNTYSTVKLDLPADGIRIAAKSDASEYNDLTTTEGTDEFKDDDSKVIAYRQGHKVGINTGLTMLTSGGVLRATVMMTFDYLNITPAATSSVLSAEQRAATMSAVLAASGIKEVGDASTASAIGKGVEEEGDKRDKKACEASNQALCHQQGDGLWDTVKDWRDHFAAWSASCGRRFQSFDMKWSWPEGGFTICVRKDWGASIGSMSVASHQHDGRSSYVIWHREKAKFFRQCKCKSRAQSILDKSIGQFESDHSGKASGTGELINPKFYTPLPPTVTKREKYGWSGHELCPQPPSVIALLTVRAIYLFRIKLQKISSVPNECCAEKLYVGLGSNIAFVSDIN